MADKRFKLTFVGGGSNFVATLAHGILEAKDDIKKVNQGIDLCLMDISVEAAERMAKYVDVVAKHAALDMTAIATDDLRASVAGADLVIVAIGQGKGDFLDTIGTDTDIEATPRAAACAATEWPVVSSVAAVLRDTSPDALMVLITNPTDTLASWVQRIYGVQCVGMCMEVPNFRITLAHLLGVKKEAVELRHIGVNHFGLTSEFLVNGEDGYKILKEHPEIFTEHPDYRPFWNWWVELVHATGYFRTSAAHRWPITYDWPDSPLADKAEFVKNAKGFRVTRQWIKDAIDECIANGTLLGDATKEQALYLANGGHIQYEMLTFPSVKETFGGLVAGLMGADIGPISLQVRNGKANDYVSEDAWLELPVKIEGGKLVPQTIKRIPEYVFEHLADMIQMRTDLSDWFVTQDPQKLTEALYRWPEGGEISKVNKLYDMLVEWRANLKF